MVRDYNPTNEYFSRRNLNKPRGIKGHVVKICRSLLWWLELKICQCFFALGRWEITYSDDRNSVADYCEREHHKIFSIKVVG